MAMFYYHAFGLDISSEIELPGILQAVDHDRIDVEIVKGKIYLPSHGESSNYIIFDKQVLIWWEGIGRVKIIDGKQIIVDGDENQIIPSLLGPVMSILLHQRGFLVLHASAVKVENFAVAFLGYRGIGKSTTAIHLHMKGYPLVADDILAIKFDENGKPIVYPGYFHVRLSDESYSNIKHYTEIITPIRTLAGKFFCDASHGFSPEPVNLKAIFILDKSEEININSLNYQNNLLDLLRHSTVRYAFRDNEQADNLIKCGKLINNVSIKVLKVNHSFEDVSTLINLIEEDLNLD